MPTFTVATITNFTFIFSLLLSIIVYCASPSLISLEDGGDDTVDYGFYQLSRDSSHNDLSSTAVIPARSKSVKLHELPPSINCFSHETGCTTRSRHNNIETAVDLELSEYKEMSISSITPKSPIRRHCFFCVIETCMSCLFFIFYFCACVFYGLFARLTCS